ncbi:DUF4260 domain-containing protein [Microbacterium sp.]|uniref:DUF4260 domain-containing protein n=1 Tax=Microbacterium sp. TaxID=51671 RepID=UPI003F708606
MTLQFTPTGTAATTVIQRVENGLVALSLLLATIVWGQPWWVLFALFLVFDLSALGYLHGPRAGAVVYNLVHNYSGPAVLASVWCVLLVNGHDTVWLALLAASWAFHVAVDRALGYGLKLDDFSSTHLGAIGRPVAAAHPARHRSTFVAVDPATVAISRTPSVLPSASAGPKPVWITRMTPHDPRGGAGRVLGAGGGA